MSVGPHRANSKCRRLERSLTSPIVSNKRARALAAGCERAADGDGGANGARIQVDRATRH